MLRKLIILLIALSIISYLIKTQFAAKNDSTNNRSGFDTSSQNNRTDLDLNDKSLSNNANIVKRETEKLTLQERWDYAVKNLNNDSTLRHELDDVIRTYCRQQDYEKAYSLIDSSYKVGDLRNLLLFTLFRSETTNESLIIKIKLLNKLSNTNERAGAIGGISSSIAQLSSYGKIDFRLLNENEPIKQEIFWKSSALYLEFSKSSGKFTTLMIDDVFQKYNTIYVDNKERPDELSKVISICSSKDAYKTWQYLNENGNSYLLNNDNISIILSQLTHQNINQAVDVASKCSKDINTTGVFESWLKFDPSSVDKWLSENQYAPPHVVDYAMAAMALHQASDDISKAWAQIEKITDPVIKKQAEGQVWSTERDMVRNSVNKDPQQAITELVSGKSQHDSYWIEEAMDVWMNKDFDKAEQWYQNNWKSLPAEKSQYAAAAFAKQAIKAGDTDAATQWLPFIHDPKTKARIEGELQKALQK